MTNMEKVLHGLSSCGNDYGIPNICEVTECPYRGTGAFCSNNLAHDANMLISELLKAQEPVEPELDVDQWRCGKCGHLLEHQELLGTNILFHEQYAYCPNCGKAVKWE